MEWEYAVPSSADWITVDDGTAGKLLVSVTKNPTAEKRTASIRITAKDNDDLEPVSVDVYKRQLLNQPFLPESAKVMPVVRR